MNKPIDWLYEYFFKKGKIPGETREDQVNVDYFDAGLIDSFGVIELITEIESKFNIELKSEHMQDKRFRTIRGLSELIEEIQTKKDTD